MSEMLDRYEGLCVAAREGRLRYAVTCEGERWDGFPDHGAAERWALEEVPGRHFRVTAYVVAAAA